MDQDAIDAALLSTLLTNAPVGFAFFDRDLCYRRINAALAEMNGVPAECTGGTVVRTNSTTCLRSNEGSSAVGPMVRGRRATRSSYEEPRPS